MMVEIKLIQQYGTSMPGTVLTVGAGVAEGLVGRKIAKLIREIPENKEQTDVRAAAAADKKGKK